MTAKLCNTLQNQLKTKVKKLTRFPCKSSSFNKIVTTLKLIEISQLIISKQHT